MFSLLLLVSPQWLAMLFDEIVHFQTAQTKQQQLNRKKRGKKSNEKYAADVFRSTMLCRSKGKTVLYINKLWHRIKNGYFICLFWRTRSLFVALFILFCIKRHSTKTYTQIIRCVFQVSKEKINFLSIFNFYRH